MNGRISASLHVLHSADAEAQGLVYPLDAGATTIGREVDNTVVITSDQASRHHARVVPAAGGYVVQDLGSTNGTYLDRTKVTSPLLIPPGVPIRIGKTVLELRS